jgi:hypothetical protein
MMLPLQPLVGHGVSEGAFLVDATAQLAIRPGIAGAGISGAGIARAGVPWWDLAQRLRWTIDLFERLEQRERVQP